MRLPITAIITVALLTFVRPAAAQDAKSLWTELVRLDKAGQYARALEVAERLLPIAERDFGPTDPFTAQVLNALAYMHLKSGSPEKSEQFAQRALRIDEARFGPRAYNVGEIVDTMGEIKAALGEYSAALALYLRAVNIFAASKGGDDERTVRCRHKLAGIYMNLGNYASAEAIYSDMLNREEARRGRNHPLVAVALDAMGGLYEEMGDLSRAEATFSREVAILEATIGERDPNTAIALDNLAGIYAKTGRAANAVPLYERALRILERAVGPNDLETATCLNNLAASRVDLHEYAKAAALFERVLGIQERALGAEHPTVAATLSNLAEADLKLGRDTEAETRIRRALEIREKTLGPQHVQTAYSLGQLATFAFDHGHPNEALALGKRKLTAEEAVLANILSFTTEQQRLMFMSRYDPYPFMATSGDAAAVAQAVLRHKGVVLDSLLEDRRVARASGDPGQRASLEDLISAKRQLVQLELGGSRGPRLETLRHRVEGLESNVARAAGLGRARRSLTVTVDAVQALLPSDSVLVEYLRYKHRLPNRTVQDRYGAVIIARAGVPTWISLGDAKSIEESIMAYRGMARGGMPQRAMVVGRTAPPVPETGLSAGLRNLASRIWEPVGEKLPSGVSTVIVSPDGELNFVSFATLLGADDRFLGERLQIRYVAGGRDMLRDLPATSAKQITIVSNADFDAASSGGAGTAATALSGIDKLYFQPLPGTAAEGTALANLFRDAKVSVTAHMGTDASERTLFAVRSPYILHLATHGYFLPQMDLGRPDERKVRLQNPMLRSGLALAGANRTLAQWLRGQAPPIENDGMVSAAEVGDLQLDGTCLVTLSACDTGGGEASVGEGVLGLRRGFVAAGARHLVVSLWPVADADTAEFMVDFYKEVIGGAGPEVALPTVQRKWLTRLRKDRGLQAAVQVAGPFIVSSQGRP